MNTKQLQPGTDLRVETTRIGLRSLAIGAWLGWARNRLEAVRRMQQRRQAIGALARMSDWRLQDLGIPRDQIAEVVDGLIARQGPTLVRR